MKLNKTQIQALADEIRKTIIEKNKIVLSESEKRNINEQNDPNLKTFPALNVFDISDSTQEIKFLYDNDSDKGNNLIALTGNGICLLLTDKRIISQIDLLLK